jgi:hypothetical protein
MWDPREDSYIQELAARIEALDQLHQAVVDFSQQFSLDPLIDRIEALEEDSTEQAESNRFCTDAIVARIEALEKDGVAIRLNPGVTIQGPAILRTRIEALEAAQQPAPATEESSATAPPAPAGVQRRYPSPATIAECGGPCESQGPEACDCGLLQELNPPSPAPAGGMVERVSRLLAKRFSESRPGTDCTPFAGDVLREVAAAAEQMAPDKNLTWERVRLWLEVEANQ